jgi:hypothetical protein
MRKNIAQAAACGWVSLVAFLNREKATSAIALRSLYLALCGSA